MAFSILYYAFGIYYYFDNSRLNSSQAKNKKKPSILGGERKKWKCVTCLYTEFVWNVFSKKSNNFKSYQTIKDCAGQWMPDLSIKKHI